MNHAPSLVCDSPLDLKIKKGLIYDTIKMLNLSVVKKNKYKREKAKEFENRALKGKKRLTQEQRLLLKEKRIVKRDKFEKKHCGNYELIYPVENQELMKLYAQYQETAK